jgi:pimeloyl-ACP methyl ester carboxylesterase
VPLVRANGLDFQVSRLRSGSDGDRPIIVCIHGLGVVDHSSMAFTLGMPLATTAEVILYDLRGRGRSEVAPTGYRVADHVADLVALLDALGIDRPVHLLGGSYGGCVAVMAALEHPERVASLIMIDAHFPVPDWGSYFVWMLDDMKRRIDAGWTLEEVMEILQTTSRRRSKAIAEKGERLLAETTIIEDVRAEAGIDIDAYAGITCPVLGCYGDGSAIFFLADALKERVPGAELHIIPGADHIQVFWRTETRDAVREFVTRVHAEGSRS